METNTGTEIPDTTGIVTLISSLTTIAVALIGCITSIIVYLMRIANTSTEESINSRSNTTNSVCDPCSVKELTCNPCIVKEIIVLMNEKGIPVQTQDRLTLSDIITVVDRIHPELSTTREYTDVKSRASDLSYEELQKSITTLLTLIREQNLRSL